MCSTYACECVCCDSMTCVQHGCVRVLCSWCGGRSGHKVMRLCPMLLLSGDAAPVRQYRPVLMVMCLGCNHDNL